MGNNNSHGKSDIKDGSGMSTPRGSTRSMRSGSNGEVQDQPEKSEQQTTSLVPVEKLGKLLAHRSQKEDGVNGVTEKSFTKYLFPMYPELARQFYNYVHRTAKCKNNHIPLSAFRQQCEKILAMLDDNAIIETYIRMFSSEPEEGNVTPNDLRALLYISYKLSMDHYPEGPQACPMINKTLSAVIRGCFNNKDSHSVGFVVRWLEEHCHRLIFPIHRYCVHILATRHRDIESLSSSSSSSGSLELGTPVLERGSWAGGSGAGSGGSGLLPVSAAWLLAATAPPLYSRPAKPPPHPGGTTASTAWMARLVCALPSHWVPLYASNEHGLGANRFLHHTLAYRGPTLVVIEGKCAGEESSESERVTVVVCAPQEWRDTHQYWGGPQGALVQLYPTLSLVECGPKLLYLNSHIRGYPRGLRSGSDPRRPLLSVNEGFDSFTFKGVPYTLCAVEVWGCGEQALREAQLEVKKWQVREAERQRQVKISAADWIEHPDRYLLELAGRPQYNNAAT
ncbi:putative Ankyrin repeat domain-containing protein 13C [Danaus plexippus plexippus]|uniref:Ankyrin repeat domain-containing protein 13C n=1 Tax=Danaus plexippus plexippus TaxID=278856 RepID=A0A212FME0_DANPL|nr:putative Ankyrin repeat domain-containing protein 13C [Danaus plexippus plexippus]